jgi:hypothetical protein
VPRVGAPVAIVHRFDLRARPEEPRLAALASLEQAVARRLPASMKPVSELADGALRRLRHAPAVFGPVEVCGHSEMPPCWRQLLLALAETVPVTWAAGPRRVPDRLRGAKVEIRVTAAEAPETVLVSCANPMHEANEAVRWIRALIAAGEGPAGGDRDRRGEPGRAGRPHAGAAPGDQPDPAGAGNAHRSALACVRLYPAFTRGR